MNADELDIAEIMFKNKVYESVGQSYQDFFTEVMTRRFSSFTRVKPQGRFGDKKNDGYDKSAGKYYQVYAPEKPDANITKAVKKARKDFKGLYSYWQSICPIREYYFVFNDRLQGTFPKIEAELAALQKDYSLDKADVFQSKDLRRTLFELKDQDIRAVLGTIPKVNTLAAFVERGTPATLPVKDSSGQMTKWSLNVTQTAVRKLHLLEKVEGRTAFVLAYAAMRNVAAEGIFSPSMCRIPGHPSMYEYRAGRFRIVLHRTAKDTVTVTDVFVRGQRL